MNARDIVSETTGWVIVHPEDGKHPVWVETDYFTARRRLGKEDMERYRPGCIQVRVKLVPIEEN